MFRITDVSAKALFCGLDRIAKLWRCAMKAMDLQCSKNWIWVLLKPMVCGVAQALTCREWGVHFSKSFLFLTVLRLKTRMATSCTTDDTPRAVVNFTKLLVVLQTQSGVPVLLPARWTNQRRMLRS